MYTIDNKKYAVVTINTDNQEICLEIMLLVISLDENIHKVILRDENHEFINEMSTSSTKSN